ncbi:hypothetical protein Y032_0360g3434 [Ancylostoma ceylanicum]|uniref:Uncharacterized protein n=1 Tax=Ancylostoma ceylanicum TaxID=53326 RepID=A0A016RWB9_9BILA|nr:hypothetical protein Y032_0360g3434 [Ancylostoma ceylanicum]
MINVNHTMARPCTRDQQLLNSLLVLGGRVATEYERNMTTGKYRSEMRDSDSQTWSRIQLEMRSILASARHIVGGRD